MSSDDGERIPSNTRNRRYIKMLEEVAALTSTQVFYAGSESESEDLKAEFLLKKKTERNAELLSISRDLGGERIIQTRPIDEQNIRNAIEKMKRDGIGSISWRMKDNTVSQVSIDELEKSLTHGQDEAAKIWNEYNAS